MPHPPCLIVLRGLNQLITGIHDKGTVTRNRFTDRLSAEDEKGRVLFCLEHHSLACVSEQGKFGLLAVCDPLITTGPQSTNTDVLNPSGSVNSV